MRCRSRRVPPNAGGRWCGRRASGRRDGTGQGHRRATTSPRWTSQPSERSSSCSRPRAAMWACTARSRAASTSRTPGSSTRSTARRTSRTGSGRSGVSVALVREGRPVAGAVCAPFLGDTWVAGRGEGAWRMRDGEQELLQVSDREASRAVVGTGFPFRRKELFPRYLRAFEGATSRFEDLRRPGAASLDLAWVAAGVFDGFFELGAGALGCGGGWPADRGSGRPGDRLGWR